MIALDAIPFTHLKSQFDEMKVHRELVKCLSGFKACEETNLKKNDEMSLEDSEVKQAAIATGNWGCGAFNGDIELKCKLYVYILKIIFSF